MPVHTGQRYFDGDVSIGPPDLVAIRWAPKADDVADSVEHWLDAALKREDVYYFSVYWGNTLAGQILLHDIDAESGTSLVGYHLFEHRYRGLGIGTRMLRLLQQFVAENTGLTRLVIITSRDNLASQRIAQKCGFAHAGAPREDPINGVVFEWKLHKQR